MNKIKFNYINIRNSNWNAINKSIEHQQINEVYFAYREGREGIEY